MSLFPQSHSFHGTKTTERPTCDAWCYFQLRGNTDPILINSSGVREVKRVGIGEYRVIFEEPERFKSGGYIAFAQPEVGDTDDIVSAGYAPVISCTVRGQTASPSGLTAAGASASCDIVVLGLSGPLAPSTVFEPPYTSKTRINAAFFCLRSDGDLHKTGTENLLSSSEEFLNWTQAPTTGFSTVNIEIDPDETSPLGTQGTVHKFTSRGNVGDNYVLNGGVVGGGPRHLGREYTYSLFAKAGTGNTLQMLIGGNGNNIGGAFNLGVTVDTRGATGWRVSPGATTMQGTLPAGFGASGGKMNLRMEFLADGWKRCIVNFRLPDGAQHNTPQPLFRPLNETGSTGKHIYVWGAQLEEGSVASPYARTDNTTFRRWDKNNAPSQEVMIDHHPAAGGFGKYSVQNLITYSEDFNNTGWSKALTGLTLYGYTAPNGLTTASKLWERGGGVLDGNNSYRKSLNFNSPPPGRTMAGNGPYTFSFYAKAGPDAGDRNYVQVCDSTAGTFGHLVIDLITGEITDNRPEGSHPGRPVTVLPAGDGWWRIVTTYRMTTANFPTSGAAGGYSAIPCIAPSVGPTADNIYGAGKDIPGVSHAGILIWGAQLEYGDVFGDYVKTTGTTVSGGVVETRLYGVTYQSGLNNTNDAREITAWGTIVIPPARCLTRNTTPYHTGLFSNPYVAAGEPLIGKDTAAGASGVTAFSTRGGGLEGTITRLTSGLPGATLTNISTSWMKYEKTVNANNSRIVADDFILPQGEYRLLYTVYSQDSAFTEMGFMSDAGAANAVELPTSTRYLAADRGKAKVCNYDFKILKPGVGGHSVFRFKPDNIATGTIAYVTGFQLYEIRRTDIPTGAYLEESFGVSEVRYAADAFSGVEGITPFGEKQGALTLVFNPPLASNGYAFITSSETETSLPTENTSPPSGYVGVSGSIPLSDEYNFLQVLSNEGGNQAVGATYITSGEARTKRVGDITITSARQMYKLLPVATYEGATTNPFTSTSTAAAQYYPMFSYTATGTLPLVFTWENRITTGSNWYATRIQRYRAGATTDVMNRAWNGDYDRSAIEGGAGSSNVFLPKRWYVKDPQVGDVYTIQMAATTNGSVTPLASATQKVELQNFAAHVPDNRIIPQPLYAYGVKQKIHFMVLGGRQRYGTG